MYIDKNFMKEHAIHRRELQNEKLRYELVVPTVQSPSSGDGMPRGSNTKDTTFESVYDMKEVEKKILKLSRIIDQETREIDKVLNQLKNPNEKIVMKLKYFDLMEWADIRGLLFGKKKDYYDNLDKYIDKAYRLHGNALNNMISIQKDKCN